MKPNQRLISAICSRNLRQRGKYWDLCIDSVPRTGLRQLFTFDEAKQFHREFLEDAAAELAQAGMLKASAIVASAAKNAPIRVEVCPYEEGSTNHKAWLARMKRQGKA